MTWRTFKKKYDPQTFHYVDFTYGTKHSTVKATLSKLGFERLTERYVDDLPKSYDGLKPREMVDKLIGEEYAQPNGFFDKEKVSTIVYNVEIPQGARAGYYKLLEIYFK